jgi:hypothetical protein
MFLSPYQDRVSPHASDLISFKAQSINNLAFPEIARQTAPGARTGFTHSFNCLKHLSPRSNMIRSSAHAKLNRCARLVGYLPKPVHNISFLVINPSVPYTTSTWSVGQVGVHTCVSFPFHTFTHSLIHYCAWTHSFILLSLCAFLSTARRLSVALLSN